MTNLTRAQLRLGGLALLLAGCASDGNVVTTTTPSPLAQQERPMNQRILMAVTSHDKKGSTGEPTGAYVPEMAHPFDVFTKAGYTVDIVSVRGGQVPLDGVDRKDASVAAFLDDPAVHKALAESPAASTGDAARYQAILFAG